MEEAQAKFTHGTALIIHSWSALDIAVQNEWAGPESANIRDWLGGVIVDLFSFSPSRTKTPDAEDVEELLCQIVGDEFELRLEDDSAYQVSAVYRGSGANVRQVASDIVRSYEMCSKGDFANVAALEEMYERLKRQPRGDKSVEAPSQEVEDDEVEVEEGEGDEEETVLDGEAMAMDPPAPKSQPIVDEDGFQLVQGKGRRKGR